MLINIILSKLKTYFLFLVLLMFGTLPLMVTRIFHLSSSTAPGVLILMVFLFLFVYRFIPRLRKIPKNIFLFFIFSLIYLTIQHLLIGGWDERAYQSLVLLIFVFLIAYLSVFLINKINIKILFDAIKMLVYTLTTIALLNIFTNYKIGISFGYAKAVFPFGEPSHFALFSGMFYTAYFIFSKSIVQKALTIVVTTLLAILFPNTTMLFFSFLLVLLLVKLNFKNIIIILISFLVAYNIILTSDYFLNRINITESSNNLSALVYLQGIDYSVKSLVNTNGLGLGFQMMGSQDPSEITKSIIRYLGNPNSDGVNREDGGFLAAKIITEFGLFGIILVLYYLFLFLKAMRYLKNMAKPNEYNENFKMLLAYSMIYSFSAYVFIRGIGYFNPSVFIFLVALLYSLIFDNKKKVTYYNINKKEYIG